jgi:hypothetical protein
MAARRRKKHRFNVLAAKLRDMDAICNAARAFAEVLQALE